MQDAITKDRIADACPTDTPFPDFKVSSLFEDFVIAFNKFHEPPKVLLLPKCLHGLARGFRLLNRRAFGCLVASLSVHSIAYTSCHIADCPFFTFRRLLGHVHPLGLLLWFVAKRFLLLESHLWMYQSCSVLDSVSCVGEPSLRIRFQASQI